ncbi:hypothetical protein BTO20_29265 [Mycobacterium dioxanotrophicus]|uniref:Uncharacterized protein n=1 Tax=Mycobacterium dioxanotrophicus TaxID=482462 RepID=A0A1Y0CAN2_9MYCO|nr:hypothetical protein BTO20_29265 [Mycobacterium dioxanotrophicus]
MFLVPLSAVVHGVVVAEPPLVVLRVRVVTVVPVHIARITGVAAVLPPFVAAVAVPAVAVVPAPVVAGPVVPPPVISPAVVAPAVVAPPVETEEVVAVLVIAAEVVVVPIGGVVAVERSPRLVVVTQVLKVRGERRGVRLWPVGCGGVRDAERRRAVVVGRDAA